MEVFQCVISLAVVDDISSREQGESVKQLEDGVARLVDGHDHNVVTLYTQSGERENKNLIIISKFFFQLTV